MNYLLTITILKIIAFLVVSSAPGTTHILDKLSNEFLKKTCPQLIESPLLNRTTYLRHCLILPNEPFNDLNKEEYMCVGVLDAIYHLCKSISDINYQELPKTFDQLKKEIENISLNTSDYICKEFSTVKYDSPITEDFNSELNKLLTNSSLCKKMCTGMNDNTDLTCSLLYYINQHITAITSVKLKSNLPVTVGSKLESVKIVTATEPTIGEQNTQENDRVKNHQLDNNFNQLNKTKTINVNKTNPHVGNNQETVDSKKSIADEKNKNLQQASKHETVQKIKETKISDSLNMGQTIPNSVTVPHKVVDANLRVSEIAPVNVESATNDKTAVTVKATSDVKPVADIKAVTGVNVASGVKPAADNKTASALNVAADVKTKAGIMSATEDKTTAEVVDVLGDTKSDIFNSPTDLEKSALGKTVFNNDDDSSYRDDDFANKDDGQVTFSEKDQDVAISPVDRGMTTSFDEVEDSNFFSYFMFISVVFIFAYIAYHNKQKILALVLEGRKDRGSRRRPNTASYRKLNSNLEEAVTSKSGGSAAHVIY